MTYVKLIPGVGRVLYTSKDVVRPEIKDIIRLDCDKYQYNRMIPWQDLGAFMGSAQISEMKKDVRGEVYQEISFFLSEITDMRFQKALPSPKRFTLAILYKPDKKIRGYIFKDVSLIGIKFPRTFVGEGSSISTTLAFSNLQALNPQPEILPRYLRK